MEVKDVVSMAHKDAINNSFQVTIYRNDLRKYLMKVFGRMALEQNKFRLYHEEEYQISIMRYTQILNQALHVNIC